MRILPATLAGNERYVQALRGQWTVYDTAAKQERNLTLIDYDHLDANQDTNQFHFTQELWFADKDRRRMDMVLWVNGLPLMIIENKAPSLEDPAGEVFDQVQQTYTDRIPEFIKYPPLMVAAARGLQYAPTWNLDFKAMNTWKVQEKDYGLIVDYVGVFENLQRALSADEDNPVPEGLIDLAQLKERFEQLRQEILMTLAAVDVTDELGRTDRLLAYFDDDARWEAFFKTYKELQAAYEILSPDPFLRPYLDDYGLITGLYLTVYNHFSPEAHKRRLEYQILKKTDHLIRENVTVEGYITELPRYPITYDIAKLVAADNVSDRVKVTNLYRSIMVHIEEHEETDPYLCRILLRPG